MIFLKFRRGWGVLSPSAPHTTRKTASATKEVPKEVFGCYHSVVFRKSERHELTVVSQHFEMVSIVPRGQRNDRPAVHRSDAAEGRANAVFVRPATVVDVRFDFPESLRTHGRKKKAAIRAGTDFDRSAENAP